MKNITKILGGLFLLEGLYFLYTLALKIPKIFAAFDYSNAGAVYVLAVYIASTVLFIIAGIGIYKNKKYGIVCSLIAVLLPQLLKAIVPLSTIPFQYNYFILILNIICLIILFLRKDN